MKMCHLHFDAKHCSWNQDTSKPIQEQIKFCQDVKCPHGSITEKKLSSGEWVAFVTCDFSWNPFDNRETTQEEREMMYP
jgi:hypothetical protein